MVDDESICSRPLFIAPQFIVKTFSILISQIEPSEPSLNRDDQLRSFDSALLNTQSRLPIKVIAIPPNVAAILLTANGHANFC